MSLQTFLSDLKRRGVFRVAGVYAVAAWLAIQVADTVLPRLGAPEWTVTFVIVVAAVGFIVAIALAWAFDITGDGIRRTSSDPSVPAARTSGRAAWFVAGILVSLSLGWFLVTKDLASDATLDPKLIAIAPFRVGGADPGVAYLREGMVDLLAATLVANDGTHAVDPATTLTRWSSIGGEDRDLPADTARMVARSLGAGYLLTGSVTGPATRLIVNVELIDAATGDATKLDALAASVDSIASIIDHLAGTILAATAGEQSDRTSLLAGVPLPVIRMYLDGVRAFRSANFDEAAQHHGAAFAADSTFVLAAIGINQAVVWEGNAPADVTARARRSMWASRDRLTPLDRAYVVSELGPNFPAPSSSAERMAAAREMMRLAPDRLLSRFVFADFLYHWGPGLGIADAHAQSAKLFDDLLLADSSLTYVAMHRVELALEAHDSATVTRLADYALQRDSTGEAQDQLRWYAAAIRGDTARLRQLVRNTAAGRTAFNSYVYHSTRSGIGLRQADEAAASMVDMPPVPASGLGGPFYYALNRGYVMQAEAMLERSRTRPDSAAARSGDHFTVMAAIYGHTDSTAAEGAVTRLQQRVLTPAGPSAAFKEPIRCTVALWDFERARFEAVTAAIPLMRAARLPDGKPIEYAMTCADFLEARLAVKQKLPNARSALARIDSTLATMPAGMSRNTLHAMNIGIADAYEDIGDVASALRVVRRRSYYHGDSSDFLSTSTLVEARLAAAVGERDAAIRAYQHYLALMSDAEAAFAENVAHARRELERLTGER